MTSGVSAGSGWFRSVPTCLGHMLGKLPGNILPLDVSGRGRVSFSLSGVVPVWGVPEVGTSSLPARWWSEGVLAGGGLDDLPLVVVDFVVASAAQQAQVVKTGPPRRPASGLCDALGTRRPRRRSPRIPDRERTERSAGAWLALRLSLPRSMGWEPPENMAGSTSASQANRRSSPAGMGVPSGRRAFCNVSSTMS